VKFENSMLVKWLTPGIPFVVRAFVCPVCHPSGDGGEPSLALQ